MLWHIDTPPTPGFWGVGGCRNAGQIRKEGKPYEMGREKEVRATAWEEVMLFWQPSGPPASVVVVPPRSHRGLLLS